MARKSTAALSITPPAITGPAEPPADLTEDQAALWREVVESKPSDWFGPDSLPVLKEYVRAAVTSDALGKLVDAALASVDPMERSQLPNLLLARDRESRRVTSTATKLRLTQQSRYTPQAAATADRKAGPKRPWQVK